MNKFEKFACLLLGAGLMWYLFIESPRKAAEKAQAEENAAAPVSEEQAASTNSVNVVKTPQQVLPPAEKKEEVSQVKPQLPAVPEKTIVLENDELKIELSSWGAVVKNAVLKKYARSRGPISEGNPAVVFDFSSSPLGALEGVSGSSVDSSFDFVSSCSNQVVFANAAVNRIVKLRPGYFV